MDKDLIDLFRDLDIHAALDKPGHAVDADKERIFVLVTVIKKTNRFLDSGKALVILFPYCHVISFVGALKSAPLSLRGAGLDTDHVLLDQSLGGLGRLPLICCLMT